MLTVNVPFNMTLTFSRMLHTDVGIYSENVMVSTPMATHFSSCLPPPPTYQGPL